MDDALNVVDKLSWMRCDTRACCEPDAILFGCGSDPTMQKQIQEYIVKSVIVHNYLFVLTCAYSEADALDARLTHSVAMRFASKRSSCGIGGALADDLGRHSVANTRLHLRFDIHFDPTSR
jgi:hypothetical protein